MVRPAGFEPATLGFEGRCSIQLSYERIFFVAISADLSALGLPQHKRAKIKDCYLSIPPPMLAKHGINIPSFL